ncbi:TonB-dependent receptor domain-containing protein [Polluticoccus soli]|uniref:TonB-dependent receptor domain-containing protein n=1 Tax=Polluticoccus soli TaxID=3034150 RepID=UPI0023E13A12|nr:TonB-dependent receptor [Flavipsychrobacter sp. JY13-12]
MSRLFILITLHFLCLIKANGQLTIVGKIVDKQHQPVAFATLILQHLPDSAIVKMDMADSNGAYKIPVTDTNQLLLKIIASGYAPAFAPVSNKQQDIILEPVGKELAAVIVSSRKPLIERKADRTVLNVENTISAIGSDAYELLRKAPGVRVTNNSVSLAGKSTVSIMIDGKLVRLGGDELEAFLRTIKADNISQIEVITTPPAKYEAEGNTGLINIVTKKRKNEGLNGNVGLSYTQRVRGGARTTLSLNYRKNKLNVFANGFLTRNQNTLDQQTTTQFDNQENYLSSWQITDPIYSRLELGADYNIGNRSTLGIMYTTGHTDRIARQAYVSTITNLNTGNIDSLQRSRAQIKETGLRQVVDVNYEWRIDTSGKKLNIDYEYFGRPSHRDRTATNQSVLTDGGRIGAPGTNLTTADLDVNYMELKADVVLPTTFAEWSFGAKASGIHNVSDNIFSDLNDGVYVRNTEKSNEFDYTENTQALYFSTEKKWDKWEGQLGLRGEYTQSRGISIGDTVTNNYAKLFPTAYLLYTPNEDNAFNINYSRRIERPQYFQRNPFRTYTTPTSYEGGNPFLQPSFSHNVELGYTLMSQYTITLYAQQVDAMIQWIAQTDSVNNSYFYTWANSGTSTSFGLSLNATNNITDWWENTVTLSGYRKSFRSDYYNTANNFNLPSWEVDIFNTFQLNKAQTLMAELGFYYGSKEQDGFNLGYANYMFWGGIRALFFDKRLTLNLQINDPTRTSWDKYLNLHNGTYQFDYDDHRCVQGTISWKFGNKNIKARRERQTSDSGQ